MCTLHQQYHDEDDDDGDDDDDDDDDDYDNAGDAMVKNMMTIYSAV